MDGGEKFFTFNGSEYRGEYGLTASQEDYLEMICRNCPQSGSVRLGVLARKIMSANRPHLKWCISSARQGS